MLKIPLLQYERIFFFFFDVLVLFFIKKPRKNSESKTILIIFPLALGDAVMMIGALSSLKKIFSQKGYVISLMCQSAYGDLFKEYVDIVIPVDFRGASVSISKRIAFLRKCRDTYYDIIIDPTGCEECTPGVFAVNATVGKEKIGVISKRKKKYQLPLVIRNHIFDAIVYKEEENIHRVRYYAEVFSQISGNNIKPCLAKLPIGNSLELPKDYIVVFPAASTPIKMWPVERFENITKRIIETKKTNLVVCGTKADYEITEEYLKLLGNNYQIINFLNKTNVISLIELIARSSLVLTNDTSVYHIAVATGRKTCCVTGDYSQSMFIDYENDNLVDNTRVRAIFPKWECANCENNCKKIKGETYPCVEANSELDVWNAIKTLLEDD